MPINMRLDILLAERKMKLNELADAVDITVPNLSILKTGKAKAIRFSTLEAICQHLQCQPGDLLEFRPDGINEKQLTGKGSGSVVPSSETTPETAV